MASDERWVGVDDVASHLTVGKDSVYRWVEKRGLPARKVGRLLRFRLSEVDAWVEAGSGAGNGPAATSTSSQQSGHEHLVTPHGAPTSKPPSA